MPARALDRALIVMWAARRLQARSSKKRRRSNASHPMRINRAAPTRPFSPGHPHLAALRSNAVDQAGSESTTNHAVTPIGVAKPAKRSQPHSSALLLRHYSSTRSIEGRRESNEAEHRPLTDPKHSGPTGPQAADQGPPSPSLQASPVCPAPPSVWFCSCPHRARRRWAPAFDVGGRPAAAACVQAVESSSARNRLDC